MRIKQTFLALSIVSATYICADDVTLKTIQVQEHVNTTIVKDVSGEDVRSADLADALYKQDADVQLVRRSGIANDIILRGMRKDNINILIDGGKIYGGCPNRMDPPLSHVLASNVDHIIVKEGPYDVENFGTLSGIVLVDTLAPKKGFHGEGNLNVGSWGYRKIGAKASGGSDKIRVMVGASTESGDQYKDGDGDTLAEQIDKNAAANSSNPKAQGARLKPAFHDMKAYDKKTAMVKLFADVTDNQQLKLSYTLNKSKNVLYPNTPMDALKDDSDLFNAKYTISDLGPLSKKLEFLFYNSWVYHPMGNNYRMASNKATIENIMHSRIYGAKVKNSMELAKGILSYGIDGSKRRWRGHYTKNGKFTGYSINDAITKNRALFAVYNKTIDVFDMEIGTRYDDTTIGTDALKVSDNDYNAFSAYMTGVYHIDENTRIFGGFGKASRVPDGKELYFQDKDGNYNGDTKLDQTTNYQIDVGSEKDFDSASLKGKIFYSKLKDFIAYNAITKKYENVDAKLYGISFNATYALNDSFYLDGGASYQRGKKDHPLLGQNEDNMPNIAPLKGNIALNYDADDTFTMRLSMLAAKRWSDADEENGEQKLGGYAVFNLKIKKDITKGFEVAAGIDNLLDKTYAMTNTYADMTLVSGGGKPMLMNEPGRYSYLNLSYKF